MNVATIASIHCFSSNLLFGAPPTPSFSSNDSYESMPLVWLRNATVPFPPWKLTNQLFCNIHSEIEESVPFFPLPHRGLLVHVLHDEGIGNAEIDYKEEDVFPPLLCWSSHWSLGPQLIVAVHMHPPWSDDSFPQGEAERPQHADHLYFVSELLPHLVGLS